VQITVYTKPACVQCISTFRVLDANYIEYEVVDLSQAPGAVAVIEALGHDEAPVVVTPWAHWSGFRPDLINALSRALQTRQALDEALDAHTAAAAGLRFMALATPTHPDRTQEATFPAGELDEDPLPTFP
jgi:glutaredoxin-like protein NrdH